MEIKFNGSEKQNKWAAEIIRNANLTDDQVDHLLRYAGPTMYAQGVMDVTIVIENRNNLTVYADSLGNFYKKTADEKHTVAEEAVGVLHQQIKADQ